MADEGKGGIYALLVVIIILIVAAVVFFSGYMGRGGDAKKSDVEISTPSK